MNIVNQSEQGTEPDIVIPEHDSEIEEQSVKIAAWAHRYAQKNEWVLNPDEEECAGLIQGLATNRVRFGKQYCPCRIRSGDPEIDKKIICPCIYHRDEIRQDGHCHCRLFFRKDTPYEAVK